MEGEELRSLKKAKVGDYDYAIIIVYLSVWVCQFSFNFHY